MATVSDRKQRMVTFTDELTGMVAMRSRSTDSSEVNTAVTLKSGGQSISFSLDDKSAKRLLELLDTALKEPCEV